MAARLIKLGADVAQADVDGNTALHIAARAQNAEIVGMLLTAGADTGAKNKQNKTAAEMTSNEAVAKLFPAPAE